jgi:hypothetical protein
MVRKTWVRTIEYHLIQQSLGMSPKGVRRRSLPDLDTSTELKMAGIKQVFDLAREGPLDRHLY